MFTKPLITKQTKTLSKNYANQKYFTSNGRCRLKEANNR